VFAEIIGKCIENAANHLNRCKSLIYVQRDRDAPEGHQERASLYLIRSFHWKEISGYTIISLNCIRLHVCSQSFYRICQL